MSNNNNFSLVGIGSNVRFGKGNGFVKYTAGSGFYVLGTNDTSLTTLSVADATLGTHAVALEQLYNLVGSNPLTAGSGISFTNGTIAVLLASDPGLSDASGLKLDYTQLATAGSVGSTDLTTISQSGTVYSTTVSDLVYSSISIPPSTSIGTIIADGVNSSFNIGYILPNYTDLDTYVSKVKMTIEVPFTGNSVATADVTDSTNTLMTVGEDNIAVANTYWVELPLTFISSGSQCVVNFTESDNTTPAAPTAGTAVVAVEYVLAGDAGTGGGPSPAVTKIVAGTGLTGGTIISTGTIAIGTTGVTAGTYGDATHVSQIVVNAEGQITSATNIAITGGTGGGNVTGPLVATDSAVALYDGTTGELIKNSSVTIDGSGNISGNSLTIGTSGKQISEEAILYNTTTDSTPTQLYLDGASQQLVLPNNSTWLIEVNVAARRTDAANESDVFWFAGGIDRQASAATTAMIGTANTTNIEQSTNWSITVSADTSNGALKVVATGEAGKTIRWTAFARIVEALN